MQNTKASAAALAAAEAAFARKRDLRERLKNAGRLASGHEAQLAEMSSALSEMKSGGSAMWPHQAFVGNRLLRAMPRADFDRIASDLQPVDLELKQVVLAPDQAITRVYFIDHGLVSCVGSTRQGWLEFGIIGCDGFVGAPVVLGVDRVPHQYFVQLNGRAWAMDADALRAACEESPTLRTTLLKYVHTFQLQTTETALANASQTVEKRLARWLLLYDDRAPDTEFHITHEFLSRMLGVRRASVTVAIHVLEGEHFIRARRSSIMIRDRAGLEKLTADCYGGAESEYDRLLPPVSGSA